MADKIINPAAASSAASGKPKSGLGVLALASIVISSMIGGGIYSLPQNMAAGASAGAVLLAWVITGFGVFFIANTFRILSTVKPDLTAGIYMYSREGFGPYVGFTIGWSYWLCQICGNVGYAVITMDALNYFFPPYFAGGNNLLSIIGGSVLIWGFNFLVLRGIKQATVINIIGTIAKIVPLILFILILLFVFQFSKFDFNFWGEQIATRAKLGGLSAQIKSTMLVTLWAFIGIEGAVVMSKHASSPKAVGRATVLGFLGCLIIYILLSLLPFGYMTQAELAAIPNPSTARRFGKNRRSLGRMADEHRPAGFGSDQLAGLDDGYGADSAGCRPKRHISERICRRERKSGAVGFALGNQRADATVYSAGLLFQQRMEHHAEHYQRYGAAGIFLKLRLFVESLRRRRISERNLYPAFSGPVFGNHRFDLCPVADLCRRTELSADGRYLYGAGHSGLHVGTASGCAEPAHVHDRRSGYRRLSHRDCAVGNLRAVARHCSHELKPYLKMRSGSMSKDNRTAFFRV